MKIGELSRETSTPIETIRYYEREGLLPETARTESNYRVYCKDHARRLAFIRRCRNLDMALNEIRVLLHFKDAPEENCGEVNILLDKHIGHVTARIRELHALERQLKSLRDLCREPREAIHCGIMNELDQGAHEPVETPNHARHVHGAHAGAAGGRKKNSE